MKPKVKGFRHLAIQKYTTTIMGLNSRPLYLVRGKGEGFRV
jgi:hypothetical protein